MKVEGLTVASGIIQSYQATLICVYLVIVVMAVEEGLLPEDHTCQHTAQAPHIQTVVIHLKHTHTKSEK